ncbi:MAG TPA: DcaP family trimeric outer membrane transporter [Chitinophagaceae bacterium]|jgi:outer membrane DcaP-like protein|nr:DcaP family trimeric outer membrane transporter [Chitinophagaceae bacterium]
MRKAYLKAIVAGIVFLAFWTDKVQAQEDTNMTRSLRVYGFAMVDMGYNFDQIDPRWFDALRLNRLPKYKDQFAPDGTFFFGVRQTRFGVAGYTPTKIGDLKVVYEFDMFGTGSDEGQTTMRLRYAYGELGRFLAGQATSPFMDDDAWPNTIEYWGPCGMVFYRNVQIRYAPIKTADKELFIALERPGAGADKGTISIPELPPLDSVKAQLSAPDVSAHFKKRGKWGSVQLAGILRPLKWKDTRVNNFGNDLSGSVTGWGANLSAVLNLGKSTVFRGSYVYGEGIENYMQDAPNDVGTVINGNSIDGKALPVSGIVAWLDHNWNPMVWTSLGYSTVSIDNTETAQGTTSYKKGQYALLTIGTTPFTNTMAAIEFQWGQREGEDGFKADCTKIQVSFKYNFSTTFFKPKGGQQ